MADLRILVATLGYTGVRTLLNSGNVVFRAAEGDAGDVRARIESALVADLGIRCRVTVLTANDVAELLAQNPLVAGVTDHTRLLVAIFGDGASRDAVAVHVKDDWSPSLLRVSSRAAYLWCPHGILASPLFAAVHRTAGHAITMRNLATFLKIDAMLRALSDEGEQ